MTSSANATQGRYRFGDLSLDVGQRRVWRDGVALSLTRRTFALLQALVEGSPNVVTHAEIANHVWGPSRIVTPENMAQHVKMLRRALDDDATHPRYVEVVRGEGYRLVPGVLAAADTEPQWQAANTVPRRMRRRRLLAGAGIAGIVSIVSMTALVVGLPGPGSGVLTAGLASSRPLPSVADELVRALAHGGEGDPQSASEWVSGRYPVSADARQAYDLYLEALEWMSRPERGNYDKAEALLHRAVQLEPEFAHAYAMTAWLLARAQIHNTYQTCVAARDALQAEQLVVQNAERALALDPGLGRAYVALADIYETSWRWADALRAYRQAEASAPWDPYVLYRFGSFETFTGNYAEAIDFAERAVEVQPEFVRGWLDLAVAHLYAGDADSAAEALYRASASAPGNLEARLMLGLTEAVRGNGVSAEAQLRSVERFLGDTRPLDYLPKLAMGFALLGRDDDVARLVEEVESYDDAVDVGAGTFALTYLAAGDKERARQWLELAVEKVERNERDPGYYSLVSMKHNFFRHPVLEEPAFRALRAQLDGF